MYEEFSSADFTTQAQFLTREAGIWHSKSRTMLVHNLAIQQVIDKQTENAVADMRNVVDFYKRNFRDLYPVTTAVIRSNLIENCYKDRTYEDSPFPWHKVQREGFAEDVWLYVRGMRMFR